LTVGRSSRPLCWDLSSRAVIVSLFTVLAVRIAADVIRTGHLTGLLLLASELLVVALTVIRRPALVVDRSLRGRLLTALSMIGPPLVVPDGAGLVADAWTALASAVGLLVIIAGKLSLGRSFGLVPANRGVVSSGLYRRVRHPIYLGYLVTHAAFLVAHPTAWNLSLLVAADLGLVLRAIQEERTLVEDLAYAAYCRRVRWRLVPGLF